MIHLETDVLVVGSGGAGMYAAIGAARNGADVILADKSMISRGGATIMAQMTTAAALGEQEPDSWQKHLEDTLEAGRGLCNEELSAILCEEAIDRIREMDDWKVGWARKDDKITGVMAPGHSVPRCVYVDFLNTGPAVAKCLRTQVARADTVMRVSGLAINDVVVDDGVVVGAVGWNLEDETPVTVAANAVILAAGGLTRLYARNSASVNMNGDAYAMALRAGADLIDMEFPQFFPIGHLAPRLVGMDPIMWDPFRYKLGGRLFNAEGEEFLHRYGGEDAEKYTTTRDIISYGITKENEAGRATENGGVHLSFQHIPEDDLREAFGPVIDKLAKNGIDLTKRTIEVSPIAHYHMGGIRVNRQMETGIPGLYGAGEAVGGANGANRLSGNAIPEAFVFGERAGKFAADYARGRNRSWSDAAAEEHLDRLKSVIGRQTDANGEKAALGEMWAELQKLMWDQVGVLRTGDKMTAALTRIQDMRNELVGIAPADDTGFNMTLQDWYDLRSALLTAESVTLAAINRTESRGAHQREDFEEIDPAQTHNQRLRLDGGGGLVSDYLLVGATA
ncbi:MAG: FAD-binding protein [Rhodospirillaceae bacterium TMED63]|nr:succinate dehydrogenase [Rhodospirillaceae bacterium]RPG00068.1 MAG: FAD-binding protein [Rhodospirillaceae bacterium TMED63]